MTELEQLAQRLQSFAEERDWLQHHSPKNLCMALAAEVGELVAEFQWLSEEQSVNPSGRTAIEDELADVFIYLVRLSTVLGVDLAAVASRKIDHNERRFPLPGAP